jgi:hypothetical protein
LCVFIKIILNNEKANKEDMDHYFMIRGFSSTRSRNLDNMTEFGIYAYNGYDTTVTGTKPFSNAWGLFFVIHNGFSAVMQVCFDLKNKTVVQRSIDIDPTTLTYYSATKKSGATWGSWS